MHVREMIEAHPEVRGKDTHTLIHCIEECYDCVLACLSCADACTAEPGAGELRQCIRLDLDCADVCFAAGALASRRNVSVTRNDTHTADYARRAVVAVDQRAGWPCRTSAASPGSCRRTKAQRRAASMAAASCHMPARIADGLQAPNPSSSPF
jgi:hypothetical protein